MKQPKEKPCQYSVCGKMFMPHPNRFNQRTCDNIVCAVGYVKEKETKKEAKKVDTIVKAYKADLETNDLSKLKDRLQEYINKIVRLVDKSHPCMSSGREVYTVHAGHFYSVGANEPLRYHLLNIWAQSDSDNRYGGGQITSYRIRLLSTFGSELIEEIDGLKAKYPYLGLRKMDLIGYISIARRITLELEKKNKIYSTRERLELRIKYNDLLGIYR